MAVAAPPTGLEGDRVDDHGADPGFGRDRSTYDAEASTRISGARILARALGVPGKTKGVDQSELQQTPVLGERSVTALDRPALQLPRADPTNAFGSTPRVLESGIIS